jgi:uncharacterized protein YbjT (DUF2867 family)
MSGPVLLAGASGQVGSRVLARLLAAPDGPAVLAPVRRPLASASHRLTVWVSDLADADLDPALAARLAKRAPLSSFICCLGTTLRAAGSREAFLAVDRELVRRLGELARGAGARHAILVSSVGASAQSGNFYLRVKGEAERAIADLGFDRVDFLRPGLLLGGERSGRPGEAAARALAPLTNPLLWGPLRRYRGIHVDTVAAAAVALASAREPGRFIHEYSGLLGLAGEG